MEQDTAVDAKKTGIFQQVKKEFEEGPIAFSMHVIGTLAVIYEVASSLIRGDVRVAGDTQAPTAIDFLEFGTVLKICALLVVQFILVKGQVIVQSRVDQSPTARSVVLISVTGLIAAWLTVVNVHWMFLSPGIDWMSAHAQAGAVFVGLIVGGVAAFMHLMMLLLEIESKAKAGGTAAGANLVAYPNALTCGAYFFGLAFLVFAEIITH